MKRIVGIDIARALAVFGMVFVNFKVVAGAEKIGPAWLIDVLGILDGRAAATFVVLAGVGMALLTARAQRSEDGTRVRATRVMLLKRALFLFVVGLAYTPLWPADILHFYGIYITLGVALLTVPSWRLATTAATLVIGFVVLLFVFDYETGWDWATLSYAGFWTADGMIRHLFFNGFHPVVPWAAFLLYGIILGRMDLRSPRRRLILLLAGTGAALFAEISGWLAGEALQQLGASVSDAFALTGTEPMPPNPFYMLAGGGTATAIIAACIAITDRYPDAFWVRPLAATGQLALTLYVAHVVLGMGTLALLGRLEQQSALFVLATASTFCAASLAFAHLWRRRFARGPLEWVIRKVAG